MDVEVAFAAYHESLSSTGRHDDLGYIWRASPRFPQVGKLSDVVNFSIRCGATYFTPFCQQASEQLVPWCTVHEPHLLVLEDGLLLSSERYAPEGSDQWSLTLSGYRDLYAPLWAIGGFGFRQIPSRRRCHTYLVFMCEGFQQ
jgi:hypothetical protein